METSVRVAGNGYGTGRVGEGRYEGNAADKVTMIDYSKTGANKR